MGVAIEVDRDNFLTTVIEESFQKPVLIDFFATWCGPCQILKPILENLAKEYDFVLAKVDIDRDPELANRYNVEGVPDVRIAVKGEVLPGFVGVLPEKQLRELLNNLNLKSELDVGIEGIQEAKAAKDLVKAKEIFDRLFAKYPNHPRIAIEAAKFLISLNQIDSAKQLLATINPKDTDYYAQARGLESVLYFKQEAQNLGDSELDRQFAQAASSVLEGEYELALKKFLEIVATSRKYKEDGARKAMLQIFTVLGENHRLTKEYQNQLMMTLY